MHAAVYTMLRWIQSNFFASATDTDLVFWSKWTILSLELRQLLSKLDVPCLLLNEHAILNREIEQGHISSAYGVLLSSYLLVRHELNSGLAGAELLAVNPPLDAGAITAQTLDLSVFSKTYQLLFDASLNASPLDSSLYASHGELSFSRACVAAHVSELLNWYDQGANLRALYECAQFKLKPICIDFMTYQHKKIKHAFISKKRLSKIESFKLEMQAVQNHNRMLISQYIDHISVPEFARNMLQEYWVLKMSFVQNLGESSVKNWNFYWTFVTRFTRYFKTSEASSSLNYLNSEFDFLYHYFLQEVNGSPLSYENSKFINNFREYHLNKLSYFKNLSCSKFRVAPSRVEPQYKKLSINNFDNMQSNNKSTPKPIDVGQLLWLHEGNLCYPCEVLLTPTSESIDKIQKVNVYAVSVDEFSNVLLFSIADFNEAFTTGILTKRSTAQQCYQNADPATTAAFLTLPSNLSVADLPTNKASHF